MLPARHRMRRRVDFATTVRRGRRGAARRVVVHVRTGEEDGVTTVGFVVPRSVGGAVGRNLVRRRLRALMAHRVPGLPGGTAVVVRALPAAAGGTSAELGHDLDVALAFATRITRPR